MGPSHQHIDPGDHLFTGGIDVNEALGTSSPYPWELEIAYQGNGLSSLM